MEYLQAKLPQSKTAPTLVPQAFKDLCDCAKLDESAQDSQDLSQLDSTGILDDARTAPFAQPGATGSFSPSPMAFPDARRRFLGSAAASPVAPRPPSIVGSPATSARQQLPPTIRPRTLFDSSSRSHSLVRSGVRASPARRELSPRPCGGTPRFTTPRFPSQADVSQHVAELSALSMSLQASFAGARQSLNASASQVRQQSHGRLPRGPSMQMLVKPPPSARSSLTARAAAYPAAAPSSRAASPAVSSSGRGLTLTAVEVSPRLPQACVSARSSLSVSGSGSVMVPVHAVSGSRTSLTAPAAGRPRSLLRASLSSSTASVAKYRSRSLERPILVAQAPAAHSVYAWPSSADVIVPATAAYDLGSSWAEPAELSPLGWSVATSAAETDVSHWASQRNLMLASCGASTATTAASVTTSAANVMPVKVLSPAPLTFSQPLLAPCQMPFPGHERRFAVVTPRRCHEDPDMVPVQNPSLRAWVEQEDPMPTAARHCAMGGAPAASWPTRRMLAENLGHQDNRAHLLQELPVRKSFEEIRRSFEELADHRVGI